MGKKRMTLSQFEKNVLKEMAIRNNCDMKMLIDALHSNIVSEQISIQIKYKLTGELPR